GMRSGGLAGAVGAVGVQKVFVVNMGMGGMGGGMGNPRRGGVAAGAAGAAAAAGTTGGLASRLTSLFKGGSVSGLKGLFTRVPVLGALIAGAAISGTALADDLTGAEKARGIGGDLGALGGALGGSALGASIGSVVPGLGTLLGGIVGGVLGGFGGQFSGEQIAELLTELIDVTKENGDVNVDVAVNPNAGGPVVRATAARRARRGPNVHAGPPLGAGGGRLRWLSQLRPRRLRGIPFHSLTHRVSGGRRGVHHEFRGSDQGEIETFGLADKKFTFDLVLFGDDMRLRNAMWAALDAAGAGELIHPFVGTVMVEVDP